MNKTLEKIIFVLINLLLSSSLLILYIILGLSFLLNPFKKSFIVLDDQGLFWFLGIFLFLFIFVWYLKTNLFRLIYKAEKFFPYLHKFFDRFLEESGFRDKIFVGIFIFDIIVLFISASIGGFEKTRAIQFPPLFMDICGLGFLTLLLGGGALICYVAFFLFQDKKQS